MGGWLTEFPMAKAQKDADEFCKKYGAQAIVTRQLFSQIKSFLGYEVQLRAAVKKARSADIENLRCRVSDYVDGVIENQAGLFRGQLTKFIDIHRNDLARARKEATPPVKSDSDLALMALVEDKILTAKNLPKDIEISQVILLALELPVDRGFPKAMRTRIQGRVEAEALLVKHAGWWLDALGKYREPQSAEYIPPSARPRKDVVHAAHW